MNLVELIVMSLKDGFGFQQSILEQHISARNIGDANVWEYTDELLVSHKVIIIIIEYLNFKFKNILFL